MPWKLAPLKPTSSQTFLYSKALYFVTILSFVGMLVFNKLALEDVDLISHNIVVLISSALIATAYLVFNVNRVCSEIINAHRRVKWLFLLYAPFAAILPIYLLGYAQQRIPLSTLGLLSVSYFAFTHLWSHLFGVNELYRHEALKIIGIFVAAAAFFKVSFEPGANFAMGVLSALLFAILVGLSHTLVGVIRRYSPTIGGPTIAVVRIFPAGVYAGIFALMLGAEIQVSVNSAAAGLLLGIFSFSLYLSAVLNGANETSTVLAIYPIPTFIIAVVFFNNSWSLEQVAAGGLMLLLIWYLQTTQH